MALPQHAEDSAPDFAHHDAAALPLAEEAGLRLRLIAGQGWGLASPAAVASPLFYADAQLAPGARVPLPEGHEERGAYVVQGEVEVAGTRFESGRMLVFRAGDPGAGAGPRGARLLLLGGAAMDGRAISTGTSSPPHRAAGTGQGGLEGRPLPQGVPATTRNSSPARTGKGPRRNPPA